MRLPADELKRNVFVNLMKGTKKHQIRKEIKILNIIHFQSFLSLFPLSEKERWFLLNPFKC